MLDAVLGHEVDDIDRPYLVFPPGARDALFQLCRVPRQIQVDHGACYLEVEPDAAAVRRKEQPTVRITLEARDLCAAAEGREAIRGFFRGASGIFSFAIHYSLNGHIEVDGDIARARWYLFMPCTVAAGNQAMWRAGIDHETYARVDGAWMFRHKRSEPLMSVPFETGWARTRFA